MSTQHHDAFDWERITFARARVLREIADGRTEREVADRLQVAYSTGRSHVAELKGLTGSRDVRELGRWWRNHRSAWLAWCVAQAGAVVEEPRGGWGGNSTYGTFRKPSPRL